MNEPDPGLKDRLLVQLAFERGYVTEQQLDEARDVQKAGVEASGVVTPLVRILVGGGFLRHEQANELKKAVAARPASAAPRPATRPATSREQAARPSQRRQKEKKRKKRLARPDRPQPRRSRRGAGAPLAETPSQRGRLPLVAKLAMLASAVVLVLFLVFISGDGGTNGGETAGGKSLPDPPTKAGPRSGADGRERASGRRTQASPDASRVLREERPVSTSVPAAAPGERPSGTDGGERPDRDTSPEDDMFARLRRESKERMARARSRPGGRPDAGGAPTPVPAGYPGAKAISFQDGVAPGPAYAGTRDTYIREHEPTRAFGRERVLLVDGDEPSGSGKACVALLRWDVSAVPRGGRILAARITIGVTNTSSQAYEIFVARRAWTEGEASWHEAAAGDAWQAGGAEGGADRGGKVLGRTPPGARGTCAVELGPDGVAVVQSWVNDPSANKGIIVASSRSTDGLDFESREAAVPDRRPRLTVVSWPAGDQSEVGADGE